MKSSGYRGNKGLVNLYPNIINEFPVHKVFWELCAGSAEITKRKVPALFSAAVDKYNCADLAVKYNYPSGVVAITGCVISFLKELQFVGKDHLIYIDAPYLKSSVPSIERYYPFTMSEAEHSQMLDLAASCTAAVVISHYPAELYDTKLSSFRSKVVKVNYHGHIKEEKIYMNFDVPEKVHQLNFIGENKTKRQQYKRMASRWLSKYEQLPPQVRQLIMSTLDRSYNQLPVPEITQKKQNEK